MTTRPIAPDERLEFFADPDQRGFLAEESGKTVGWVAWNIQADGDFYAHSLFCDDEHPHAAAALFQAARRQCRALGRTSGSFCVDASNPHLLRFVNSGRARIETYVLRMSA